MKTPHSLPPLLQDMQALGVMGFYSLVAQALIVGAGTGLVIGLFRWLYTHISAFIVSSIQGHDLYSLSFTLGLGLALVLLALISGWIVHKEPLLGGSGIPQVELTLRGHLPLPWLRLLLGKFVGTLICLSGGLSVGREGPSIQMGAAVGCGVGALWFGKNSVMPRFLIAGSAAGMTAAFGAPCAGLLFAFEEMKTVITVPLLLFTACAAGAAYIVIESLFGFGLVYPFAHLAPLAWQQYPSLLVWAAAIGLLGALYNAGIMGAFLLWDKQKIFSSLSRPLVPFLCSGLLLYAYPQVLVGFGVSVDNLEQGGLALAALGLLLLIKIAFSILSFSSGVSGGLLMPMLSIGAMAGALMGTFALGQGLVQADQLGTLITLSMGALFAATVRAPLTGGVLVLEMTGAWSCAPAMLVAVYTATFVANHLHSAPIYDAIKVRLLKRTRLARHRQS